MGKINLQNHVWEGWTVADFICDLQPVADMIQAAQALHSPFKNREEVKKWCMENQPYYKKYIPGVVNYFCQRYQIT